MVGTTMGHCWRTLMVALTVLLGAEATLQGLEDRAHSELLFELGAEDYPEFHEGISLDRSPELAARRRHNFLPDNSDGLLDRFEAESRTGKDLRKRSQPDPLLLKKWSEVFSAAPTKFLPRSTLRNRGRSYFLKDYFGGKLHYLPAKKRPAYYSEPEGSEFLGGPGK